MDVTVAGVTEDHDGDAARGRRSPARRGRTRPSARPARSASSITWSERRSSGSPARIGLAACRSAQSRCAASAVSPVSTLDGPGRGRLRPPRSTAAAHLVRGLPLQLDQHDRLGAASRPTSSRKVRSSSSTADGSNRSRAATTSASGSSDGGATRRPPRAGGHRVEPPLDRGHDAERALGADHEVEQVAGGEVGVEGVARGVLAGVGEAGARSRPTRPG